MRIHAVNRGVPAEIVRIKRRTLEFLSAGILLFLPCSAHALPAPFMIFGFFEFSLLFIGLASAGFALAGIAFLRMLNKRKNPIRFLIVTSSLFALLWLITLSLLLVNWSGKSRENYLNNLEAYMRSDINIHESRVWYCKFIQHYPQATLTDLHTKIMADPEYRPLLLISCSLPVYASGIPGVGSPQNRRLFERVDLANLEAHLQKIPLKKRNQLDLYWIPIQLFYRAQPLEKHKSLLTLLASFRRVYYIKPVVGITNFKFKQLPDNRLVPAIYTSPQKRSYWPVRPDVYFHDEPHVRFPNMTTVFFARDIGKYISDQTFPIVAPYNGIHRSREIQLEYLYTYCLSRLGPVNWRQYFEKPEYQKHIRARMQRNNIYAIDYAAPDFEKQAKRLSAWLRDKPFLVVALTKHDWLMGGMDFCYRLYQDSQTRKHSFRYLGATLQIAEFSTLWTWKEKNSLLIKQPLRRSQVWITQAAVVLAKITTPFSDLLLMLLALLVFAALSPLLIPGLWAQSVRRELTLAIQQSLPKHPYRARLKPWLLRKIGYHPFWEMIEKALSLITILACFKILVFPDNPLLSNQGFFLSGLDQPQPWFNVLLVLVSLLPLLPRPLKLLRQPGPFWKLVFAIVLSIGFLLLLNALVPVAYALFAFTFLVLRLLTARAVTRTAKRRIAELFNLKISSAFKPKVFLPNYLVPLAPNSVSVLPGKAAVLAKLFAFDHPLFSVPPGFVLFPKQIPPATSEEYAAHIRHAAELYFSQAATQTYAVRSCAATEDSRTESQAGRFSSILNVTLTELPHAVDQVLTSYQKQQVPVDASSGVIIQKMITAEISGVLFTQSPKSGVLSHIEYVSGAAESLVSGRKQPKEIFFSRWSGAQAPQPDAYLPELQTVFFSGMLMENFLSAPQDIEWVYCQREHQLYIVQARPITKFLFSPEIHLEQERFLGSQLASLLNTPDKPLWDLSPVYEVVNNPSPFTFSLLQELYSTQGSLGIALDQLHITHTGAHGLDVVPGFNRLYIERLGFRHLLSRFRYWQSAKQVAARLKRDPAPLLARLRALQNKITEYALPDTQPTNTKSLAAACQAQIRIFITQIYPPAFHASLLCSLLPSALTKHLAVPTQAGALAKALQQLSADNAMDTFLSAWGYRSTQDYDLLFPSFRENPQQALDLAKQYQHFQVTSSAEPASGSALQLLQAKEEIKDLAIQWLRQRRPWFLALGKALKLTLPENIFYLTLADLSRVAAHESWPDLKAQVSKNKKIQQTFQALDLPDPLKRTDIEFLNACELFPAARLRTSAWRQKAPDFYGQALSVPRDFSGEIAVIEDTLPLSPEYYHNKIVVTKFLKPQLVSLYGTVAGILTERGGYLSHAALVAREKGVPILQVAACCSRLSDGDQVYVQANGDIHLLPRP